jgi:septal ring factor EnvC (AmiA/AmiB activator)
MYSGKSNKLISIKNLFIGLICLSIGFSIADDLDNRQQQIEKISQELKSLQKVLSEKQNEASEQRTALKTVETKLGALQSDYRTLEAAIKTHELQKTALASRKTELTQKLADKSEAIKSILRLAYKQNNQPLIKLLLSGGRPEDLSRHFYYFSILTQNQQIQLDEWLRERLLLSETISTESKVIASLESEKKLLAEKQDELSRQKNRRTQVIANLLQESKNTEAEIARKKEEREKLSELIKEIKAKLDSMSLEFPGAVAISGVKGKLNWPVSGKLTNGYGRTIDSSGLRWQGWLITTQEGTPVKAVHGGRIVFADFFKSNGLLVIIDHGNGIWTLYGRNRALLQDVGSWVEAGDVIAEVGQSGGYNQSGLYFEVRKNGEPQNPAHWLKKR